MLRNPGIANLFQRIHYIEKMGTGIERIRIALRDAGAPEVIFELENVYVRAIFPKPEGVIVKTKTTQESPGKPEEKTKLGEKLGERLSRNERLILENISRNSQITIPKLSKTIGISTTAVENNLNKLKEKGNLRRIGPARGGRWEVLRGAGNE